MGGFGVSLTPRAMDRTFLFAATFFALIAGIGGMRALRHGRRSRWTLVWMLTALACQIGFLALRGQARNACPLADHGEILAFLAWSLTLFYIAVGPAYRISLLGVFTAPVVVAIQTAALLPGVLDFRPLPVPGTTVWGETHSATSVLSYGALALAAVAGAMFLTLDRRLKEHQLKGGLFKNLPTARELLVSLCRLLWIGVVLLTIGIVAGFLMPQETGALPHLVAAMSIWTAYVALLAVHRFRGLAGRLLAKSTIVLFILSLAVFALI